METVIDHVSVKGRPAAGVWRNRVGTIESHRIRRRLQLLSRMKRHEQDNEQIFSGNASAGRASAARERGSARIPRHFEAGCGRPSVTMANNPALRAMSAVV